MTRHQRKRNQNYFSRSAFREMPKERKKKRYNFAIGSLPFRRRTMHSADAKIDAKEENMSIITPCSSPTEIKTVDLAMHEGDIVIDAALDVATEAFPSATALSTCSSNDPLSSLVMIQHELYRRGIDSLEVCDLLQFVAKLQEYRERDGRPDKSNRHLQMTHDCVDEAFDRLTKALLSEYVLRVKYQVREWLDKSSWERRGEVFPNSDGHLVTNDPEDIMYVIHVQLAVAKENVSPFYCLEVMVAILEELEQMQRRIRTSLNSSYENIEIERICSVINDCASLYEKFDSFKTLGDVLDEMSLPSYKLNKKIDQVAVGYVNLAVHASDLLAKSITEDVNPILANVHTPQWEHEDQITVLLSTLRDYYADLSIWIPQLFYSKCVKKCLECILQTYVESFFAKGKSKVPISVRTVACLLEKDRLNLVHFFGSEHAEQMKQVGLGGTHAVEDRFEILRAMSYILLSREPSDVGNEVKVVLSELGNHYGKASIMYLAKNAGQRSREKMKLWDAAINAACESNSTAVLRARTQCDLSHLLQSRRTKTLKKIRTGRRSLLSKVPFAHTRVNIHNIPIRFFQLKKDRRWI